MSRRRSAGWRRAGTAGASSANRRSRPGCSLSSPRRGTAPGVTPSRAARSDDAGAPVSALTSLQVGSVISYVIAMGVATAGSADPRIALLVACSALGAFLGDNLSYLLGRRFGPRVERRFFRGEQGARRRAWAEGSLQRFGMQLIVVCRFFPGGRTAVTLCCGIVGYPRRRFVVATAVAGVIWASYSFFIGRLGGKAFQDAPWVGFAVAFGVTIAISGLVELIRRIVSRRW